MKTRHNVLSAIALSAALFCFAGQSNAATTAASSMHYGKPTVVELKGTDEPIVITNCTESPDMVSAWFTDGSSNTMQIQPQSDYPYNIITIGDSSPYVNIQVAAMDGTILYPDQPVYPGQNVNIGCNDTSVKGKPMATIASN